MTAILWLAITLGGIVGFIVFIASDFATHQVVYFLAKKWKSLQFERAKLNELKLFALVNRLHAGKRDRYIFLTMSSQIVAVIAIFSAGIAVIVFISLESTGILKRLILCNSRFRGIDCKFGSVRFLACFFCRPFQTHIIDSTQAIQL